MKISLIGYGKMGKAIEEIAISRGHTINAKLDSKSNLDQIPLDTDVAIEFTKPESAKQNISYCIKNNIPIVIGTTGWYDDFEELKLLNSQYNSSFLHATNFSIGVNIFFKVNQFLAKLMEPQNEYKLNITEIHHTQKLDAPSGTAITTAEGIINNSDRFSNWNLTESKELSMETTIPILAERLPNVPGTHIVDYSSKIDTIELKHTAHNRTGFSLGAVLAAEFLADKKGIFTMNDVLNI